MLASYFPPTDFLFMSMIFLEERESLVEQSEDEELLYRESESVSFSLSLSECAYLIFNPLCLPTVVRETLRHSIVAPPSPRPHNKAQSTLCFQDLCGISRLSARYSLYRVSFQPTQDISGCICSSPDCTHATLDNNVASPAARLEETIVDIVSMSPHIRRNS